MAVVGINTFLFVRGSDPTRWEPWKILNQRLFLMLVKLWLEIQMFHWFTLKDEDF